MGSLGMRMFVPENAEENLLVYKLRYRPDGDNYMNVPLGITRRSDDQWRSIYTGDKLAFTKFAWNQDNDFYGNRDFAIAYYSESWFITNYEFSSSNFRTLCIAPQDGESIE